MKPDEKFKVSEEKGLSAYLLNGSDAREFSELIAKFRIDAFKKFPYLYDGNLEDEKRYLEIYFSCQLSNTILFYDDNLPIGYSSSIPLVYESEEVKNPMKIYGKDIKQYLYIGEVIFSPNYRGKKLLETTLQIQENCAKKLNLTKFCYFSVIRDENDSNRPDDYFSSDKIFEKKGFTKIENCTTIMNWKSSITKRDENNYLHYYEKDV